MLERQARQAQESAQRARDDFARLRDEYRRRHGGRKPEWAIDYMFKDLSVARDCISDDAWFSRQSTEKYTAAAFHWERAVKLNGELVAFLKGRTAALLSQVPQPREGQ